MPNRVIVTQETKTGRNMRFSDVVTGEVMTRAQFVKKIENGTYSDNYYVREINGIKTPCGKPDGNEKNNLD